MCTGVEIALVAEVAGGVLNAGAQKQAGDAQAQIDNSNAAVARFQAKDALRRGAIDEQQLKQQIGQIIGSQRAAYAGNGLAVDSGTPLALAVDTARTGALDVATIRLNTANEVWGYRVKAKSLAYGADIAKKGGTQGALGSLLGAVGGAYKIGSM